MERRAFERIPSFLSAKLFNDDSFYDGLILNLSQNGIYYISKSYLSFGLDIEISISLRSTKLKVPCKIVRMSEIDTMNFRFGAEILSPSQEYIKFIRSRIISIILNSI